MAGVMVNSEEALVCMLGVTAVGAIWRCVVHVFLFRVLLQTNRAPPPVYFGAIFQVGGGSGQPAPSEALNV